jgi:hypothetical protein
MTPSFTPTPTYTVTNTATATITQTACSAGNFGYTDIGTFQGTGAGAIYACRFELLQAAYITQIHIHISSGSGLIAAGVYNDFSGSPSSLVVDAVERACVIGWNTIDVQDTELSAGYYWLAFEIQNNAAYDYDTGGAADGIFAGASFGIFSPSFSAAGRTLSQKKISIYADFCPASGYVITATVTPTITQTPTATITETLTPYYTATPGMTPTPEQPLPDEGDSYAYPQPAQNSVNIIFDLDKPADIKLNIFNYSKNIVKTREQACSGGKRTMIILDTSSFPGGVYYYTIKGNYNTGGNINYKPNKFIVAR